MRLVPTKPRLDVVIGVFPWRRGEISDMGDIFRTCIERDDGLNRLTSLWTERKAGEIVSFSGIRNVVSKNYVRLSNLVPKNVKHIKLYFPISYFSTSVRFVEIFPDCSALRDTKHFGFTLLWWPIYECTGASRPFHNLNKLFISRCSRSAHVKYI